MIGTVKILAIDHLGEIVPESNVAEEIYNAALLSGINFSAGDLLVVTSKIISKSEGLIVSLRNVKPSLFAQNVARFMDRDPRKIEVVLQEAKRIIKMSDNVLITETHHGFICANSGVDSSNIPGEDNVCLLPRDPDNSAKRIALQIKKLTGFSIPVIISDTFGRPWREGITNVAVGVYGIKPVVSYVGKTDCSGKMLRHSKIAVADEIAAAAELVTMKTANIPAVIIRGYNWEKSLDATSKDLIRPKEKDLFR